MVQSAVRLSAAVALIAIANRQAEIICASHQSSASRRQAAKDAAAKASKPGSEGQEAIVRFLEPPKGAFALMSDVGDREPVETYFLLRAVDAAAFRERFTSTIRSGDCRCLITTSGSQLVDRWNADLG